MKYYILFFLLLTNCENNEKQISEEGKKNWEFVECMNKESTYINCKIIDLTKKVQCMSKVCGRPYPKQTSMEFIR